MSSRFRTPAECPVCGATVPAAARSCPECGADERTGWNETTTRYDGLDLPEDTFDESGKSSRRLTKDNLTSTGMTYGMWLVAVAMLALVGALVFYRFM